MSEEKLRTEDGMDKSLPGAEELEVVTGCDADAKNSKESARK
jgi:hypothetical protein